MRLLLILLLCASSAFVQAFHVHITPTDGNIFKQTGDNLMLLCQVSDVDHEPDEILIDWFRDDSISPINRNGRVTASRRNRSNQLLFVKPTVEDSGTYRCAVTVDDEEKQFAETNVTFIEAPKFVNPEVNQHPEHGTTARIVCTVDGDESREIFWQFQGNNIHEESQRGYKFDDKGQVLVIPNYSTDTDDGIYTCNAALFATFESLAINVTGYVQPEITVFNGPSGNRALESHSVRFECQATGKPKPTYQWMHQKDGASSELKTSDKYNLQDGLLIIESVSLSDAGEYTCVASNALRDTKRTVAIEVFQKPRIEKLRNVTVEQGHVFEIVCEFQGEGTNVTWFFDEEPITAIDDLSSEEDNEEDVSEDDVGLRKKRQSSHKIVERDDRGLKLRISAVSQSDSGKYSCVAENEAGKAEESTVLLITHGPYMINQSPETIRSYAGHTVTLFCEVSAIPAPVWGWYLNDNEISANGHTIVIDDQPTTTHLKVQTDDDTDYGSYKCSAKNEYGSIESTVITVQQIFAPSSPAIVKCDEFSYPNYGKCSVSGYETAVESSLPTKFVIYYATEKQLENDDFSWEENAFSTESTFAPNFEISALAPSSRYFVRVKAVNEAGVSELSIAAAIETTDASEPEKVSAVTIDCGDPCVVSWAPANDHGSKIISYKLTLQEVTKGEDEQTSQHIGDKIVLEVNGDDSKIELRSGLRSKTAYELELVAVNGKGLSEPFITAFHTSDLSYHYALLSDSRAHTILIVCVVAIVAILVLVDLICFCTNQCGVIACFCTHCLGRPNGTQKSRDIERGNRGENNRLLEEAKVDGLSPRDKTASGPHSTSV